MYFTKITLHNFKRFTMHTDKTFSADLNDFNILTWRNGYGKSSLLSQINVLPIEKSDFNGEGYKELHLVHDDKNYVIYSGTDKHSILEDGVELNTSGNKRTYLEVIKDKFNITPDVIKYVNGYINLTEMSPNLRKEVLFSISHIDYDYSLGIYTKLLNLQRDGVALLKYNTNKLGNLNTLVNPEDNNVAKYTELKSTLLELKEWLLTNYNQHIGNVDKTTIKNHIELIYSKYDTLVSINNLDNLDKLKEQQVTYQTQLANLEKEKLKLQEDIQLVKDLVDDKILQDMLQIIVKKEQDYDKLLTEIDNLYIKNHLVERNFNIITPIDKLLHLLSVDIELVELDMSQVDKLTKLEQDIANTGKLITTLQDLRSKLDGMFKIKCDNCDSIVDMSAKIKKLDEDIERNLTTYKEQEELIVKLQPIVNRITKKKNYIDQLNKILVELNLDIITDLSTEEHQFLYLTYTNLKDNINIIRSLQDEIKISRDEYSKLVSRSNSGNKDKDKELQLLLAKDKTLTDEIIVVKRSLKEVTKNIEELMLYNKKKDDLKEQYLKLQDLRSIHIKSIYNEYIDKCVSILNDEINELDNKIRTFNILEEERKNLLNEINKIQEDIYDYKLLSDKLNPKNGLIAKSINSFIGIIIQDMNTIIKSVWSYDMTILPCEVVDSDLDFKFRVMVNDTTKVEDVSKLSSSMKEIVNLAFRLVYIKYSKLRGIPLILDEFGSTMDKEHASKAFDMIQDVLRNSFEQIFLISHFDTMYGRFKHIKNISHS